MVQLTPQPSKMIKIILKTSLTSNFTYYECVMIDVKQHLLNVHYHRFLDQPYHFRKSHLISA